MLIGSNSVAPGRAVTTPDAMKRLGLLIIRDLTLKGVVVGSRRMMVDMVRAMDRHSVKPLIDRVYDFEEANDAIAYVSSGDKMGKVLIRIQ